MLANAPTAIGDALDVPENRSWRPFQLAFVLLTVPGLADPTHEERTGESQAIADLLWFPTGGGKTYLACAAVSRGASAIASTSSPSFWPQAAKTAVENFSPRPELPRGFTPSTT